MSKSTKEILKGKDLVGKYNAINAFLDSTFNITNPALHTMAKANPIMATIVLEELKNIDAIVVKDAKGVELKDINVIDIATNRESELSRFVHNIMLTTNPYAYTKMEKDLNAYHKAKKLDKAFPLDRRKERVEQLKQELAKTNDTIALLSEVDGILAKSYVSKLSELQKEHDVLEESIYVKDITVITTEVYSVVIKKLNNIKSIIDNKIEFLEGIVGK